MSNNTDTAQKDYRIWGKGIQKPRSRLGLWLIENNLNQQWLHDKSRVNKNTISKLCSDKNYTPKTKVQRSIVNSIIKAGYNVSVVDFWECDSLFAFNIWLINNGITQEFLSSISNLSESTIKRARETKYFEQPIHSCSHIISSLKAHGYQIEIEELWAFYSKDNPEGLFVLTPFGEWLYEKDLSYSDFAKKCDASTTTIKKYSEDKFEAPSGAILTAIMREVKKIDPTKRIHHFWDI